MRSVSAGASGSACWSVRGQDRFPCHEYPHTRQRRPRPRLLPFRGWARREPRDRSGWRSVLRGGVGGRGIPISSPDRIGLRLRGFASGCFGGPTTGCTKQVLRRSLHTPRSRCFRLCFGIPAWPCRTFSAASPPTAHPQASARRRLFGLHGPDLACRQVVHQEVGESGILALGAFPEPGAQKASRLTHSAFSVARRGPARPPSG